MTPAPQADSDQRRLTCKMLNTDTFLKAFDKLLVLIHEANKSEPSARILQGLSYDLVDIIENLNESYKTTVMHAVMMTTAAKKVVQMEQDFVAVAELSLPPDIAELAKVIAEVERGT